MAKNLRILPLGDNVIIEPQSAEEVTAGGIIIPDTAEKDRPEQGLVVAVGPGKMSRDGKRMKMEVKKGDVVLFKSSYEEPRKIEGKEYFIIKENDILAVLEE